MDKENNEKIRHILNDFVTCEEYCNLNCKYCLSEGAQLKENHDFHRVNGRLNFKFDNAKNKILNYCEGHTYKEKIDTTLKNYSEGFDAPIFKISGGEVTLVEKFHDIMKMNSERYEVVQLLTNGILLNEKNIEKLAEIKNINVQLSLDGHTFDMNACRYDSVIAFNIVRNNLDLLYKYGINTELYCVLTEVNISNFFEFCNFILDKYNEKVQIVPFPVRLLGAKKFFPKQEQLESIKKVIDNYHKFKMILPPKAYMEEMYDFIYQGERKTRCYVPRIMSQIFDDGVISPCPNCWTVKVGNINKDIDEIKENMVSHPIYRLMLSEEPKTEFCKKCFTDYHVFNLFFDEKISLDELVRNRPDLQGEKTKTRLLELKKMIYSEYGM